MSTGRPLATLRLACGSLDPDRASQILFRDRDGTPYPGAHGFEIKSRNGVWLASTDEFDSPRANDHLRAVIDLLAPKISEIRAAFPGVAIDFSLLVFDPTFTLEHLSHRLLSSVTALGSLEVEMPQQGKGATFTADTYETYAV